MNHKETIKIYVISHKKCVLPALDICYQPLLVGAKNADNDTIMHCTSSGWNLDDTGYNISEKNSEYCELTGLYWAWKNTSDEIVGMCHYRRYFVSMYGKIYNLFTSKVKGIYTERMIRKYMSKYDIVVHNRTFFLGSVYEQYKCNHDVVYMERARMIIEQKYPEYLDSFTEVMKGKSLHFLNMFIMRRELMNKYCEWLFDILTELESVNKHEDKDCSRLYGYLAERLLDVWVRYNRLKVKETFTVNTERVDRRILI